MHTQVRTCFVIHTHKRYTLLFSYTQTYAQTRGNEMGSTHKHTHRHTHTHTHTQTHMDRGCRFKYNTCMCACVCVCVCAWVCVYVCTHFWMCGRLSKPVQFREEEEEEEEEVRGKSSPWRLLLRQFFVGQQTVAWCAESVRGRRPSPPAMNSS
jgi:hypothetical protein